MNKLLRQAFTLIELLVVIAIIGILSGLIVVTMSGVTQKANIAKAQVFSNSLKSALMIDMISEWKLDGGVAGNTVIAGDILDTWSVNHAVSIVGGPVIKGDSDCVSGNCLQFNGISDAVSFGNKSAFSMGLKDQAVSIWARFDNIMAAQNQTLIACGAGGVGIKGYLIWTTSGTGAINAYFNNGSAQVGSAVVTGGTLVNNTWYNIVVTFDRDGSIQAYVNGVKQGPSFSISAYQLSDIQNDRNLTIGAYSSDRLIGKLDEIRMFSAIPTTSQIQEQYYSALNKMQINGSIPKEEYVSRINNLTANK